MSKFTVVSCLLLLLIVLGSPAIAQTADPLPPGDQSESKPPVTRKRKPIEASRPRQAQSANTVGDGTVQLEMGTVYRRFLDDDGDFTAQTSVRVGTSENSELRLQTGPGGLQGTGMTNFATLGYKLRFSEEPSLGLLVNLNVPIGARGRHYGLEPQVRLLGNVDLNEDLQLVLNAGASLPIDERLGDRYVRFSGAGQGQKVSDSDFEASP